MAVAAAIGKPCRGSVWPVKETIMPALELRPSTQNIDLPDEAATKALARSLAALTGPGDVIALYGELGAGKTVFARAFINALARPAGCPAEEVPSPTFTLVQVYDRLPAPVWHFDLFRLDQPADAYELGIEEAFAGAIVLIEWPQRLGSLLPVDRLDVSIDFAQTPSARRVTLAGSPAWLTRLRALKHDD